MSISFGETWRGITKSLFTSGKDSVLGVDIGSSSIKIVQLRKEKGKAILETYGELALGPYAATDIGRATQMGAEDIAGALTELSKEANVTATQAGLSIPVRSSLLKVIRLPTTDRRQISKMAPIEARKYVPVPIGEVTLDWWVIPEREKEFSPTESGAVVASSTPLQRDREGVEVLLVAIHNDTLRTYQDVISKVGLTSRAFEIETFSAIRSTFGHDMLPTLILDIGAASTKVAIVEHGLVRSSHIIGKGSQDITMALSKTRQIDFGHAETEKRTSGASDLTPTEENKVTLDSLRNVAEPILDYIFFETKTVIRNYERDYRQSVAKVILIGGGSLLAGLIKTAEAKFEVEVLLGDPFHKTEAPAFLSPLLTEAGPSFAIAVGLALRELQDKE